MPTLDWLNRAEAFSTAARVPYRLLEPQSAHGDGDPRNLLIQGDNLEALKALLPFYRGQVKCIFIDPQGHYLKVLMDEVFGRGNFIATIAWEKDKGGRGDADISTSQDMVLAYATRRKRRAETRNLLERTTVQAGRFRNPDNDPRGPWRQGDDGTAKSGTEKQPFRITLPSGREDMAAQIRLAARALS